MKNRRLVFIGLIGLLIPGSMVVFFRVGPPAHQVRAPEFPPRCAKLYSAVCHGKNEIKDPTGFVRRDVDGELEALRIYEEIIRDHPDWNSNQVDDELARRVYTPKKRRRLIGAYRWVEREMIRFIDRQNETVFSKKEKAQLKKHIRKLKLQLPPPASIYSDQPDLLTKNDVYYERLPDGATRLRIGGAYLFTVKSWFNIVFTLAHEMAHAIDPCEIRLNRLSFPAYDRVSACFMEQGWIAARKTRSECGENDQLSETFADWLAVHIVGEALRKYGTEFDRAQMILAAANSVRDLCDQEEAHQEPDLMYHPAPRTRIERIFGGNPVIQKVLGCEAAQAGESASYCGFEWNKKEGSR